LEFNTAEVIALAALFLSLLSLINSYVLRVQGTKSRAEDDKRELMRKAALYKGLCDYVVSELMYLKEQYSMSTASLGDMRDYLDDIDKSCFRKFQEHAESLLESISNEFCEMDKGEVYELNLELDKAIAFMSGTPENIKKRLLAAKEHAEKRMQV